MIKTRAEQTSPSATELGTYLKGNADGYHYHVKTARTKHHRLHLYEQETKEKSTLGVNSSQNIPKNEL